MQDSIHSTITDKACLVAVFVGGCLGMSAILLRGFIEGLPELIDPAKLQLLVSLTLSMFAGFVAAIMARNQVPTRFHAPGIAGRLGIRAGLICAALAAGILTLMATVDAHGAESAILDRVLRARMWLVLAVSMASLLPGVLCGFLGGLMGAGFVVVQSTDKKPVEAASAIPWLPWAQLGIAGLAVLALASPILFVGKAPVVDPPPLVITPPPEPLASPPFRYAPPDGIKSARMGEIQPDFTKVIPDVKSTCPVAMSPDGVMIAYGDSSGGRTAVGIFDLHQFSKFRSVVVPAFPQDSLAWSPDQKAIACTIGEGQSRRIWILNIETSAAIELPRPPGRDVPNGAFYWWQEHELAFFPEDEAPLAFDLDKLLLTSLIDSPHYKKLDETNQKKWMNGPRLEWPEQSGWRLGLRTLITSAVPPSRRNPEATWELSGLTICAYEHPQLPLAHGIRSLQVDEDDRIVCSPDGSKLAHLRNGRIEVTYMKKAASPDMMIEVEMPQTAAEVASNGWSSRVESKELCLLICAPLINPLNQAVVGPDFQHIHGLARLHEWKDRKAVFILPNYGDDIQPDDVVSTPHSWYSGKMSEWKAPGMENWWAPLRFSSSPLPEKIGAVELPQLLTFEQETSSMRVVKGVAKPRSTSPPKKPELPISSPATQPVLVTEQDVKAFLMEHHAKASRGDVIGMLEDYDHMVDFLDKGLIPVADIESEENEHRQKWPKGSEQVVGSISVTNQSSVWNATYTIAFHNENASGDWHKGRANLSMNIRAESGRLYITSQRAKVYDVTNNRAELPNNQAPAAKASQDSMSYPITVPRPCFITVTRSNEMPQIEYTDQISFVGGIAWHRTYRELSSDGKVLRACRAIYTGNGGVAANQNSAGIYVHAQEWDRVLGGGTFTGVCSRNAASLVGKSFQFQFVNGGMVESQSGTVFQLQK